MPTKETIYTTSLLYFFNRILLERGMITHQEYQAMLQKISEQG